MPEQYRTDDTPDLDGFRAHYDELVAEKAQRDEALSEIPDSYEFTVPQDIDYGDIELPEDFAVNLKTDDPNLAPIFSELGDTLKQHNLPASAANDFMGLLAKYEAAKFSGYYKAENESLQKMGPSAQSRRDNVVRKLENLLPEDQAQEVAVLTASAGGIKALEALLSKRGPTSPSPSPQVKSVNDDLEDYYSKPTSR